MWEVIENRPFIPIKKVDDRIVRKPKEEFTANEWQKVLLDKRPKHKLCCSLSANDLNYVTNCATATKIWDTLVVTFEGIKRVKDNQINRLLQEYKMFKIND